MTIPVPVPVSQFPNATLPLSGTERLPMVQGGITVQVPSSALSTLATLLQPEGSYIAIAGVNPAVDVTSIRWLFVDTTAGEATIPDFTGGAPGLVLVVTNLGPNLLVLDGAGIFGLPDTTLPAGASELLYFSDTLSKWVLI